MRHSHEPWIWPLATALALLFLLATVFLTPRSWLAFGRGPLAAQRNFRPDPPGRWLTLSPPPEIQVVPLAEIPPDQPNEPPPAEELVDPRWWLAGWRIRIETAVSAPGLVPVPSDSVAWLGRELALEADPLTAAQLDSLVALRLALLKLHDTERFEQLKPYFHAAVLARQYRDLMSRANDMYDEFLHREIMVPD